VHFRSQLVAAAVSAASNLEESDDASSDKDFRAKERIVLRELKEAKLRLRVLLAVNLLVATIIGLMPSSAAPLSRRIPWDLGFGF
jgi:four helix bundle protein